MKLYESFFDEIWTPITRDNKLSFILFGKINGIDLYVLVNLQCSSIQKWKVSDAKQPSSLVDMFENELDLEMLYFGGGEDVLGVIKNLESENVSSDSNSTIIYIKVPDELDSVAINITDEDEDELLVE